MGLFYPKYSRMHFLKPRILFYNRCPVNTTSTLVLEQPYDQIYCPHWGVSVVPTMTFVAKGNASSGVAFGCRVSLVPFHPKQPFVSSESICVAWRSVLKRTGQSCRGMKDPAAGPGT